MKLILSYVFLVCVCLGNAALSWESRLAFGVWLFVAGMNLGLGFAAWCRQRYENDITLLIQLEREEVESKRDPQTG